MSFPFLLFFLSCLLSLRAAVSKYVINSRHFNIKHRSSCENILVYNFPYTLSFKVKFTTSSKTSMKLFVLFCFPSDDLENVIGLPEKISFKKQCFLDLWFVLHFSTRHRGYAECFEIQKTEISFNVSAKYNWGIVSQVETDEMWHFCFLQMLVFLKGTGKGDLMRSVTWGHIHFQREQP